MEEPVVVDKVDHHDLIDLPPGFRFHPTDEEIITHYLTPKVLNSNFTASAISEVDPNKCEPWDMPKRAKMGENEWYFFCQRDRKYPTGMRTNRATEAGYWKATGKDKEIYKGKGGRNLVGMKKTLVFYRGRAPKGEKTNWVMHEFRLEGKFSYYALPRSTKEEWVVSRVFHKSTGLKKTSIHDLIGVNSFADDFFDCSSLPPLTDPNYCPGPSSSSYNCNDAVDNDQAKNEVLNTTSTTTKPRLSDANSYFYNSQNLGISYPQNQLLSFQDNFDAPEDYNLSFPLSFMNSSRFGGNINDQRVFKGSGLENILPCKVEQFSSNNQSMVSLSQDTGLSNDMNNTAEISSVASKPAEMGSSDYNVDYEDLEGPLISGGSISVMDCFNWD